MRCHGCFAVFGELTGDRLSQRKHLSIVGSIAPLTPKFNFSGGEPFLHKGLCDLIVEAKQHTITSVVTNATMLIRNPGLLDRLKGQLDWLCISVDSLNPETNRSIGREWGGKTVLESDLLALIDAARHRKIGIKINTVVSAENHAEDFRDFILQARPHRWKLMQLTEVKGQNDAGFRRLSITGPQFQAFYERQRDAVGDVVPDVVYEPADLVRGSYLMINPEGCFFDSAKGEHQHGSPILDVGVKEALRDVTYSEAKFHQRHGDWNYGGRR